MARLGAFFDASVLYPSGLRNFVMHLALTGIFRAYGSSQVHEERDFEHAMDLATLLDEIVALSTSGTWTTSADWPTEMSLESKLERSQDAV